MANRQLSRFGVMLRTLRKREGLSQKRLAALSGVSERTISDLERGVVQSPHQDTALRLAEAIGLQGQEKDSFERASRRFQSGSMLPGTEQPTLRTLPRDIKSFTGRATQLSRFEGVSAATGVVGIYGIDGMPGVGKTAFAVHVAHQLAIWFRDGQLFLPLHAHSPGRQPADAADALASLLIMIGVPARQVPDGLDNRIQLWRDRLAGRHLILVLDDAASSDQVRPLLPSATGTLVLVTSREMLTELDDVHVISLDTLPPKEAVDLLITLADRQDLDSDDPALVSTARQCGYLPLAIAMAASRLRYHRNWTPADLAADLTAARSRRELLDSENLAVSAAFELSYQGLTADQRRLFRRLGTDPGPDIDAWAAAALDSSDLPSTRRRLERLYRKHLINEPARGRYQFHDLIREFAKRLAAADTPAEREAAADRLLGFYLHAAQTADRHLARRAAPLVSAVTPARPTAAPEFATQQEALAWMRTELPNLIAAVRYAAAHRRPGYAVAITAALNGFMRGRVHWDQAIVLHQMAASAAGEIGDQVALASALNDLGDLERAAGDYHSATTTLTHAMTLCREISDMAGEAAAVYGLAAVAYLTADYAAADTALARALELYRGQGDQLGEARALDVLGSLRHATSDFPGAKTSHADALKLFHDIGHQIGEASSLNHLGVLQLSMGEYSAAAYSQEHAIELNRITGDRLGEANALNNLAAAQLALQEITAAQESVTQALELYAELGIEHGTANALNHLGLIQAAAKQFEEAEGSERRAYELYRQFGDGIGQAAALSDLGGIQYATMNYPAAAESFAEALELYRDHIDRDGEACTLNRIGDLALAVAEPEQARNNFEQALAIANSIGSRPIQARALEGLGKTRIQQGSHVDASKILTEAAEIYRSIDPKSEERVRAMLGSLRGRAE
jgi:tetratricopeptide (TPR) repeat protein/transcriptional regulator with XRE-family HTH domain